MNLYLTKSGRLRRKDNTLEFEIIPIPDEAAVSEEETPELDEDQAVKKHALPIESIDAIYLFNETTLNTKLINFLTQHHVPVHVFNYYGNHAGTILPHAEQYSGDLVIQQALAHEDKTRRLRVAGALLEAAFHNITSILQYYERQCGGLTPAIAQINELRHALPNQKSTDQMMGLEGQARRIYYECWSRWLTGWADNFVRQYHPPDNPLNALLSFLNSLLYTACISELYRTALYPGISYLHAPQTRRYSLALDIVEPFKPLMVDRLLFRLFDRKEITEKHFRDHSNGVLLNDEGRKLVVTAWDEQLHTTVQYPPLKRSVSYRQLLRLDCYKLVKFLLENQAYTPYRIPH